MLHCEFAVNRFPRPVLPIEAGLALKKDELDQLNCRQRELIPVASPSLKRVLE